MKWTTDELVELMDKAEKGQCDHQCATCPIFLPTRNECWNIANEKWKRWNYEKHQQFHKTLKG